MPDPPARNWSGSPPTLGIGFWIGSRPLSRQPRPVGVTKLRGPKNLWRLRVGDYRIVYAIDDATQVVDVSIIRHRREVYRDL